MMKTKKRKVFEWFPVSSILRLSRYTFREEDSLKDVLKKVSSTFPRTAITFEQLLGPLTRKTFSLNFGLTVQLDIFLAGDCKAGSKVTHRPFSDTIVNHTLVGPVMSSITAKNERECEMECHLAVPDKCYMFNYHPSSKVCELLYKDRAAEYKVEKKKRSTFKTRKVTTHLLKSFFFSRQLFIWEFLLSFSVFSVHQVLVFPHNTALPLSDQGNTICLNFTGRGKYTVPYCWWPFLGVRRRFDFLSRLLSSSHPSQHVLLCVLDPKTIVTGHSLPQLTGKSRHSSSCTSRERCPVMPLRLTALANGVA